VRDGIQKARKDSREERPMILTSKRLTESDIDDLQGIVCKFNIKLLWPFCRSTVQHTKGEIQTFLSRRISCKMTHFPQTLEYLPFVYPNASLTNILSRSFSS
jgi:hypothetical protein